MRLSLFADVLFVPNRQSSSAEAANATYMLSYDIGIGLGALLTGFLSEQIGIARSFAVTAAFPVGALVYALYCDRYFRIRKDLYDEAEKEVPAASDRR